MMGLPTCREVKRQLSREYDQDGPLGRGIKIRLHLMICGGCRRYRRYRRYLLWLQRNLVRAIGWAPNARLSASQRAHIQQVLRERVQSP